MSHRTLVVGLDGWDHGYEEQLRAEGRLPTITELGERSARFTIDPKGQQLDGLDWEHFLAGAGPEATRRACVVDFDPSDYASWQRGANVVPFFERVPARAVVFDVPYCDLSRAPSTRGVVGWAASDPGIDMAQARPDAALRWIDADVGEYPAHHWLDTVSWPSVATTEAMGEHLVRGIASRRAAACHLLTERIPDWELGLVVVTETHTAAEAFWHGVDPEHPLHRHPSAQPAAAALRDVYEESDRLVATLVEATGADRVVVLALNGMASNRFDVPSMVLLPELLLRWSCGERLLTVPEAWTRSPADVPVLDPDGPSWHEASAQWLGGPERPGHLREVIGRVRRRMPHRTRRRMNATDGEHRIGLGWHPAMRYRSWWPRMRAFALPSFAAGHVRLNLEGRERDGIVELSDYRRVCDEVEELLRACVNPATGASAVTHVTRPGETNPRGFDRADPDLRITWAEGVCALEHPEYGLVGPVPFRRTGDHMGERGFVNFAGPSVVPGDCGTCTVVDLAPTIASLAGDDALDGLPGRDLLA